MRVHHLRNMIILPLLSSCCNILLGGGVRGSGVGGPAVAEAATQIHLARQNITHPAPRHVLIIVIRTSEIVNDWLARAGIVQRREHSVPSSLVGSLKLGRSNCGYE